MSETNHKQTVCLELVFGILQNTPAEFHGSQTVAKPIQSNRTFSFSWYWVPTSLQWRLLQGEHHQREVHAFCICKDSLHASSSPIQSIWKWSINFWISHLLEALFCSCNKVQQKYILNLLTSCFLNKFLFLWVVWKIMDSTKGFFTQ